MKIRIAGSADKEKWDSFVDSEDGSFFHYFAWKYIYESKGWEYIPLLSEDEKNQILGIFPIVRIKTFFYNKLISLPEGASGGWLWKKEFNEDQKTGCIHKLLDWIDANFSCKCSDFTFKSNLIKDDRSERLLLEHGFRANFTERDLLPCTFILELKEPFAVYEKTLRRRMRGYLLHYLKRGLASIHEDCSLNYLEFFSTTLNDQQLRFRAKPFSKEEVVRRLTIFSNKTRLFIARYNEEPVAGLLCHYSPSTLYLSKAAYLAPARNRHAISLLCYTAIKDACERSYRLVEFGITHTESQAFWKEGFRATRIPMKRYEKRYSQIRAILNTTIDRLK